MKKLMILGTACLMLAACGNTKWEYKVVSMTGNKTNDYSSTIFSDPTGMLDNMGKEGWELVDTYTETSTAFPNFGNDQYVTGLKPNTRTSVVNFVFKRKSKGFNAEQDDE